MLKREEVAWRPDIMHRQNSHDVINEEGKDLGMFYETSKQIDINTLPKNLFDDYSSSYNIVTTMNNIRIKTNRLCREGNTKLQCLLVFPL